MCGHPLGASIVSCAAHKLQVVVFPCLAAVLRDSLTCSCDNISVPPCVSDHRERGAQHNHGVTICDNSTQRLTSRTILASTQSLCSCFVARTVIREVWEPTRTAFRSMAAMLLVWQTRKRLQLCERLIKSRDVRTRPGVAPAISRIWYQLSGLMLAPQSTVTAFPIGNDRSEMSDGSIVRREARVSSSAGREKPHQEGSLGVQSKPAVFISFLAHFLF